ncbi:MAG TPA: phytanoyl-CoA dioxygenase family protein [Chloroflexota bacterium]|nr:phytanoyl-CoA dioxygenase family protein [Chloroflexota bacterium]
MQAEPFVRSDPDREAPEALRARMAEQRYLFLPALIEHEAIRQARHDILAVCARAGWLAPGTNPDDAIAAPGVRYVAGQPEFNAVYGEIQMLESFHSLAHGQGILEVVHTIVQDDVLVHPRNIARVIFPENTAFTTPAHQDFIHIKGAADTYTCWFPLGDCPPELGGLAIMAGSHPEGVLPHVPALGAGGKGIVTEPLPYHWVASPLRIGDALLFHSHTVHKGLDNVTPDRLRLSVDFRYQGASAPVHRSSLLPHHGQLTWEEIYAGWNSRQYQHYWRDQDLNVSD